mmetsp:Transcript_39970/g.81752  ORF Transcript_39970/g.81752 Transcript_39970/m.81752 type:complete len:202 (-) Transcript_39970:196-801(-)
MDLPEVNALRTSGWKVMEQKHGHLLLLVCQGVPKNAVAVHVAKATALKPPSGHEFLQHLDVSLHHRFPEQPVLPLVQLSASRSSQSRIHLFRAQSVVVPWWYVDDQRRPRIQTLRDCACKAFWVMRVAIGAWCWLGFGTWSRSLRRLRRLRLRRLRVTLLVLDALLALREVSEDGGQTSRRQRSQAQLSPAAKTSGHVPNC